MPSVNSLCIVNCVGRLCLLTIVLVYSYATCDTSKQTFWKLQVKVTLAKSIIRSLSQKTGGYSLLKWMVKLHISFFFFFHSAWKPERGRLQTWLKKVERHLSTWHTSTQDVGSCQSTTIFSMTVSPLLHRVCTCVDLLEVSVLLSLLLFSSSLPFSFRARSCLGFV